LLFKTCQKHISLDVFMPQIVSFGGSFLITIVNMFVKSFIRKFANFSRFKSASEQSTSIISTVFFTQLINTAILPILLSVRFQNMIPNLILMRMIGLINIADTNVNNYFNDTNRAFYSRVGTKYIMTFIILTFNP